jgi:hypothetical protein
MPCIDLSLLQAHHAGEGTSGTNASAEARTDTGTQMCRTTAMAPRKIWGSKAIIATKARAVAEPAALVSHYTSANWATPAGCLS